MPTLRTGIPEEDNAEPVTKDLDRSKKLREAAVMRITSYKQRLGNLYNRRVKLRTFQDRDLVLRRVFENTANLVDRKFQPNCEAARSYVMNKLDGTPIPRMWNAIHLKRYYQ